MNGFITLLLLLVLANFLTRELSQYNKNNNNNKTTTCIIIIVDILLLLNK